MLKNKTILLGVTGSIAAYKAAALASLLVKQEAEVQVLMTENACQFITPVTFETLTGHRCLVDTFDRDSGLHVAHIALAAKADLAVIAPASAGFIGRLAGGMADDMLTSTLMACTCPVLLSPAMNTHMYENPLLQDNLQKLARFGYGVIEPATGRLACRDTGKGKMPEPEVILDHILRKIACEKDFAGKKLLITAGPTQESLDPVRYLTNHSSGKMGYALARMAVLRGAEVTLISGPVELAPVPFVNFVPVVTARQMYEAVMTHAPKADIIIKAAAVADYRPVSVQTDKIKKSDSSLTLELERTDDILAELGRKKRPGQFLCGFSMETRDLIASSRAKLEKKNLDLIAANNLNTEGAGFRTDTNVLTLISRDAVASLPLMSKEDAAMALLDRILSALQE